MTGTPISGQVAIGLLFGTMLINTVLQAQTEWQPVAGHIMTEWAKSVTPDNVLAEYPRPMMARQEWQNLNGLWEYAIRPRDEERPEQFDGKILVPFAVESALSGAAKAVGDSNRLWYRRFFRIPQTWASRRVLLHFGAVDWETTVWVNDKEMFTHRGGYDPFSVDITQALKDDQAQEIVLSVWDPTDAGTQPHGKQVSRPRSIWYTAVTGIWQTVWLEPVPERFIKSLEIVPDLDNNQVHVTARCAPGAEDCRVVAEVKEGSQLVGTGVGEADREIIVNVPDSRLWSPDSPLLYDLYVNLQDAKGKKVDAVSSYFGMRKISLGKDENGITRLFLNNQALFQVGPLDQGWWPDGLYTAPTDEALRYDLEATKKLGFNMLRKHVKVEPQRFYYWCDRLGLMVWQDMPSGDRHIEKDEPDLVRSEESAGQYELEWERLITARRNHPSIVMWVPFNEGWGQFDTEHISNRTKTLDPTRLVNSASGWVDRGVGDVHDIHAYPGPAAPPNETARAAVLGEFGGLGLPVNGHTWQEEKNWGYRSYENDEALNNAYLELIRNLEPLISQGLSAAVYTQTTDVEIEVNGLMTYDRKVLKMHPERVAAVNRKLYLPEK